MQYQNLSNSNLKVSKICLGTMTFGEQNSKAEAFEQMDYALANGVNFIDTAESYSVPIKKETYGNSERIIGNWINSRNNREQIILASKIAGSGPKQWIGHIRNGETRFNKKTIEKALNDSLKRLKTDYIDLYQLHWPNRNTISFGMLAYPYPKINSETINQDSDSILETIEAMNDLMKVGKIRYYGLSNETPWGMMKYIQLAERENLAKPITIQNIYNLVNRIYETAHSEITQREGIELLAYSPLAFSVLSGKFLLKTDQPNSRLNQFAEYFGRFNAFKTNKIVQDYLNLATKHQISLVGLALAFVNSQSFVGSNIIGATNLNQLQENIATSSIELSDELIAEIEEIHQNHPNPCL